MRRGREQSLRKGLILSGSVTALLAIMAAVAVIGYNSLLLPVNDGGGAEEILVEIPPGASTGEIGRILEENGIIHNALFFRLYTRWAEMDRGFIAGTYRLNPAMSMQEIMETIARGDVFRDTVWFVIPEGSTVEQAAAILERGGFALGDRFRELCANPSPQILERFPFLREAAGNAALRYPLEGYLFPDTYEILRGAPAEEIVLLMLHRFARVFSGDRLDRAAGLGLTVHQALTLASIVEREAVVDHERERIAAVFHNRLRRTHPLQSCATIQFILGEVKEVLTYADLALESPYNTYLYPGLPPGPIAAPGEQSILAVLYPEETDYFYFNSKLDGTGEHYFSRTLAEHNRHVSLAEQNRRKR